MAVKLVFLGRLADLAGRGRARGAGAARLARAARCAAGRAGRLARGDKVKLAVNGAILADKTALAGHDGDEVALLPPVSGG